MSGRWELRWTGSDRLLMAADDLEELSLGVAEEILNEQYDGYRARSQALARAIAFNLCGLTESEQWYVHTDASQDSEGWLYSVWVDR